MGAAVGVGVTSVLRDLARAAGLTAALHRILGPLVPALRRAFALPAILGARGAARRLRRLDGGPVLCFLTSRFPAPPPSRSEPALGGAVKTTYLAERFPHSYPECNVLYTVSSVHHPDAPGLVRAAKAHGMRVVLNQNGVYYRAWFGPGWEVHNRPLADVHRQADFVVYQSEFCKVSAERFLGLRYGPHAVLLNPVDLAHYRPDAGGRVGELVLLTAAASRDRAGRLQTAVETLGLVTAQGTRTRLLVPGYDPGRSGDAEMMRLGRRWANEAGLSFDQIEFLPRYTRRAAPSIFGRAHLLLHPVYNDPSPNVVGEALACGLPVVYSASGGVPELVGPDAGVGVPAPVDWEVYHQPDPAALAAGVQRVAGDLDRYAEAARARAEAMFALDAYLEAHGRIFEELLRSSASG